MNEEQLRAGSSEVNVTPEQPVPLLGYYGRDRISTGVHDPLSASTLVLADGDTTVGVVSVDVLLASAQLRGRVEQRLSDDGVELDAFVLAATHTHSGPHLLSEGYDFPFEGIESDGTHGDTVREAFEKLESGIVESVRRAVDDLEPATVRAHRTELRDASMNRRSWGGHLGNVETRPEADPAADIDPEMVVLDVETETGDRSFLVNFACHALTVSRHESLITADFPSVVYDRLAEEFDATTLFVNGAAGDIAPSDIYDWDARLGREFEYLEIVGDRIATAAVSAVEKGEDPPPLDPSIAITERSLSLSLAATDRTGLEREHRELTADIDRLEPEAGYADSIPPSHQALLTRKRRNRTHIEDMMRFHDRKQTQGIETVSATLTRVDIGESGLLTLPGEPFVRHGLAIKDAATADPFILAGYANGHLGYLPTTDDIGRSGYEVQTCRLSLAAIEQIRDAAMGLVE